MEKILYIDCFSGISGDMTAAALIDMGLDPEYLESELRKLDITGYGIQTDDVKVSAISAKKFTVEAKEEQPHRNYKNIKDIINNSSLDEAVKKDSLGIFGILAEAEAKVHNKKINEVHFHEIGAVDSIIDIVSAAIGINHFSPKIILSRNIPLGKGFVIAAHGKMPVPAPATAEILKGIPVYEGENSFEATTPTGAAIVKYYVSNFGEMPCMEIEQTGYGSGTFKGDRIPNLLRLFFGKSGENIYQEKMIILSTNIDDSTPEIIGHAMERLAEKAKDVWVERISMKKNRPGFKLNILCGIQEEQEIIEDVFLQTNTLGIRRQEVARIALARRVETIQLPYGDVLIKIGIHNDEDITFSPEYESCKKLAEKTGIPLKRIYQEALERFSIK